MLKNISLALAVLLLGMSFSSKPVAAQSADTLTEAEIAALFAKQKTRGLSLAPSTATATPEATATTTAGTEVVYTEVPQEEQININISFDFNSSALREDQKPRLVALCSAMKSAEINLFQVVGHTDSSGSVAYNERLSLLRAEEVKRYLVNDCGIESTRIEAVGVGARFPYDAADPRADVNRRVEFQALS